MFNILVANALGHPLKVNGFDDIIIMLQEKQQLLFITDDAGWTEFLKTKGLVDYVNDQQYKFVSVSPMHVLFTKGIPTALIRVYVDLANYYQIALKGENQ